ncbi:unnamed protein product [Cuscuta europaea]|uniref:Uncharacterized protein n=1 Tax=Cuscuta europaea TaxID=41803 RepID=A0A9P0YMS6_CUSEU|nr:unnamed protein product [Cuscuta europaea]
MFHQGPEEEMDGRDAPEPPLCRLQRRRRIYHIVRRFTSPFTFSKMPFRFPGLGFGKRDSAVSSHAFSDGIILAGVRFFAGGEAAGIVQSQTPQVDGRYRRVGQRQMMTGEFGSFKLAAVICFLPHKSHIVEIFNQY